jgi:hypothetical protein
MRAYYRITGRDWRQTNARGPTTKPRKRIEDAHSVVELDEDGQPIRVIIADDLSPDLHERVLAHATGHVIHQTIGNIPLEGLAREQLERNYHRLNNDGRKGEGLYGPSDAGYPPERVDQELFAEAIRAYMTDPKYFKTEAPDAAKLIRANVNEHPRLIDTIQFN